MASLWLSRVVFFDLFDYGAAYHTHQFTVTAALGYIYVTVTARNSLRHFTKVIFLRRFVVARLNKPSALSGIEEELSVWDFAPRCFVGTVDSTMLREMEMEAYSPNTRRIPKATTGGHEFSTTTWLSWLRKDCERLSEGARPEPDRSFASRHGARDAHGEIALLINIVNFNFGDNHIQIDLVEFKLPMNGDDIPGTGDVLDTTRHPSLESVTRTCS